MFENRARYLAGPEHHCIVRGDLEGGQELLQGFENKYAELCARMTKTKMIIKELSTNVFMNNIRLTKPAGQKSQSLQDWRREGVPKLTKALTKKPEVIMGKLHRATLEVIYKDMGWVKGHIDNLKDMLRSLKLDRDMIVLPPYNVEGNMREAPVRSLFYSILTTVEYFTGQKNLSK